MNFVSQQPCSVQTQLFIIIYYYYIIIINNNNNK